MNKSMEDKKVDLIVATADLGVAEGIVFTVGDKELYIGKFPSLGNRVVFGKHKTDTKNKANTAADLADALVEFFQEVDGVFVKDVENAASA